tara:strand:- start:1713 stop:2042 length:330 start_codon:yes stop_codon:yes gene_type:complete
MTNEPAYKFIAYAHKPMFGMNTLPSEVEYTIGSHDASRDDMLDAFKYFLMAAGYSFSLSESIQVVDEDWEDAQVEAEDDLPIAGYRAEIFWTDEAAEAVEVKWDAQNAE